MLSSSAVHVFVDELPANHLTPRMSMGAADPCPIEFPSNLLDRDRVNRAVIVAPLLASGTQIAVGAPAAWGGPLSIFDVDVDHRRVHLLGDADGDRGALRPRDDAG